jgi:hypothetical protein
MKIESFYKYFLMTPVSHFPVLGEDGASIGLLSRDKISREMADLDSSGIEYEVIPEHLLSFEITDTIIKYFQNHRTIPVLNIYAQRVDTWEKPRFLAECSDLLTKKSSEKTPILQEKSDSTLAESTNKMLIYKYSELILQNFPDALFSTDKDGNTTFYNEKFEKQILAKHIFKDSITLAEKYFKELNRDLISEYFKSVEIDDNTNTQIPVLQAYVKNIDFTVRIVTLKGDEKVLGFLYHLSEPSKNEIVAEEKVSKSSEFISIEEAFEEGYSLNQLLKEVEAGYILKSFKKNHENISHTANALGIPRSTLQNRIKYLDLSDKLGRDPDSPIPRQKKTEIRGNTSKIKSFEKEEDDYDEEDYLEDPLNSQAKNLSHLEALADSKFEEKNKKSKKKSVLKRKSSSQMNSKKK